MIVKLKGFIDFCSNDFIDLDVNGVIYRVYIPQKNIEKIIDKSSQVSINVFEILKENERLFFGFLNSSDRELFSDLLTVQGVGGKMALNVMSQLNSNDIEGSILEKNPDVFASVSGVGKKIAIRIINELFEKIRKKSDDKKVLKTDSTSTNYNDLVSCLQNLGYPLNVCEKTAVEVLRENKDVPLEKLIPIALNFLSKPSI